MTKAQDSFNLCSVANNGSWNKPKKPNQKMSAQQLTIGVRENCLLLEINSLQKKLDELNSKRESLHRTAVDFENENQVVLPRRNGWITDSEKEKIQKYFAAGISARRMAEKFSCSTHTIYHHAKKRIWFVGGSLRGGGHSWGFSPAEKKFKKSVDAEKNAPQRDSAMEKQTRLKLLKHRFHRLFGKPISHQLPVTRKEIKDTAREVRISFGDSMNDSTASGDEILVQASLGAIFGKEKQAKEISPFLTRKERNQLLREVTAFKKAKQKFWSDVHSAPLRLMA